MYSQRYTQSQVLYGLQVAWANATGVDDPFDVDTQIYTYMLADGSWDEFDLADIFQCIERFFNFTCGMDEWKEFFGFDVGKRDFEEWRRDVAPKLTFGALAQFVADRAPVVASFDPIPIVGCRCATAGVFIGIQRVAENEKAKGLRFAPSTRIIDVMRGNELDRFWTQLRWMTEHSLPELPRFWREATGLAGCGALSVGIGGMIASWTTANLVWIVIAVLCSSVFYATAYVYKQTTNPLPLDIVTFRDLSELIAASRATAPT